MEHPHQHEWRGKFTIEISEAKEGHSLPGGDPGGYWWPPTFSNWLKTALWQFWQFTIFSRF
jgi:hypothetical protein